MNLQRVDRSSLELAAFAASRLRRRALASDLLRDALARHHRAVDVPGRVLRFRPREVHATLDFLSQQQVAVPAPRIARVGWIQRIFVAAVVRSRVVPPTLVIHVDELERYHVHAEHLAQIVRDRSLQRVAVARRLAKVYPRERRHARLVRGLPSVRFPRHREQRVAAHLRDAAVAGLDPERRLERRDDLTPVPRPRRSVDHLSQFSRRQRRVPTHPRGDPRRRRDHDVLRVHRDRPPSVVVQRGDAHAPRLVDALAPRRAVALADGRANDLHHLRAEPDRSRRELLRERVRDLLHPALHSKRARAARREALAAAVDALRRGQAHAALEPLRRPLQSQPLRERRDARLVRRPRPRRAEVGAAGGGKAPPADARSRLEDAHGEALVVELPRRDEAADAGADDDDVHLLVDVRGRVRRRRVRHRDHGSQRAAARDGEDGEPRERARRARRAGVMAGGEGRAAVSGCDRARAEHHPRARTINGRDR
eukprot:29438-Pelagococcus_subviridis.AAC.3